MARTGLSMQELIRRRRRAGFVGRQGELAAFRRNFDLPPEDDRHCFLFHVHGAAGVGKTFLVRELEQLSRDRGALTAYVDESAGGVPEALARIAAELARQGHPLKTFDKRLATYRQRRHEADALAVGDPPAADPSGAGGPAPSAGSMALARAGLTGLGMVPVVGAFAGALDAADVAHGADRLRAALGARFPHPDDVQLVLDPALALTPVLAGELAGLDVPWIVLFFDTYEQTGPFLDGWLRDLMTTDRYGALPANVVVVLSGQRSFGAGHWGGWADFVAELPLGPFSEAEARALLSAKGVADEAVVTEVLRLSGGLPVLVSLLAENSPSRPGEVGDPSGTAVERFLRWEPDPVRRAAALACALPRRLDEDVFRAAVDAPAAALYPWLCGLPFVGARGSRVQYHDIVRDQMLRLQRHRSRHDLAARHARLAAAFARWRAEAARGIDPHELWEHDEWCAYRLEEAYHLLCARPAAELPDALRATVAACRMGAVAARQWARALADAGAAVDAAALREWGARLAEALGGSGAGGRGGRDGRNAVRAALALLLSRPGLDPAGRAEAHVALGRELLWTGDDNAALVEYDRAIALDPALGSAHHERGRVLMLRGAHDDAERSLDRAVALLPRTAGVFAARGDARRLAGRPSDALADLDRAIALRPAEPAAHAARGVCLGLLGRYDEARAAFDRALALDGDHMWALVRRARLLGDRGEWDLAFADLDRAVRLEPDRAWIASERGDAYRRAGRHEEAVAELTRALGLDPGYPSPRAGRGAALAALGRHDAALADLDRVVGASPHYTWARIQRAWLRGELGDRDGMFRDLDHAVESEPGRAWPRTVRARARLAAGRHAEAIADLDHVLDAQPRHLQALLERCRAHRDLGAHGRARADLDRAGALDADTAQDLLSRARLLAAAGRVEQAVRDLSRDEVLGDGDTALRTAAARLLLACGRGDEALRRLDGLPRNARTDELRAEALRRAGRFAAARDAAARACLADPLPGGYRLALVVAESEGLAPAAPQWRRVRSLPARSGLAEPDRAHIGAITAYALGEWQRADRLLDAALAAQQDCAALSDLIADLAALARSPGGAPTRLAPRLALVAAARAALAHPYAPAPP
ncbi:MAG: tetratricopeptide repeat protein [Actinomycetia bacterium]|nr:tetratricopeptide repeat protein [Actinomycetes bacterium]